MIRPAVIHDKDIIKTLALTTGLFDETDISGVADMLDTHFAGELGDDNFWITYDEGAVIGVAYYAPEPFAEGVWNLYMIAVEPNRQGQGIGLSLIRHIETHLIENGARILLVDTSGKDDFALTRAFYIKCGYDQEARIRDYYAQGDDKVTFRKSLLTDGN